MRRRPDACKQFRPSAEAPRAVWADVLVGDDEPTTRMLISELLHESGYGAIEAETGAEGLVLAAAGFIRVAPKMTGRPGYSIWFGRMIRRFRTFRPN